MTIVATMTVRRSALAAYRRFETRAAAIMRRHGGAIDRVVVEASGPEDNVREVHIVTFPSDTAWTAYCADPELVALAPLRAESVIATELVIGVDGPAY